MTFFLYCLLVVAGAFAGEPRKAHCGTMDLMISDSGARIWNKGGGMYDFAPDWKLESDDPDHPWTAELQQKLDVCLKSSFQDPLPSQDVVSARDPAKTMSTVSVCIAQLDGDIQAALLNLVTPLEPLQYYKKAQACGAPTKWFVIFSRGQCPAIVDVICSKTANQQMPLCLKVDPCVIYFSVP